MFRRLPGAQEVTFCQFNFGICPINSNGLVEQGETFPLGWVALDASSSLITSGLSKRGKC